MLSQILALSEARVLVIGDVLIDRYISGKSHRLSPEAPVPVLNPDSRWSVPGGAANVAMNIAALGASVGLICALTNDETSIELSTALESTGVNIHSIESNRPIPVKTRVRTDLQQIVRIDDEIISPLHLDEKVMQMASELLGADSYNVLLISDYGKGLLNDELMTNLVALCNFHSLPVITDPKSPYPDQYRNVTLLKPNLLEAKALLGEDRDIENYNQLKQLAQDVRKATGAKNVVVTAASLGSALATETATHHFGTIQNLLIRDVSGAGDAFISYLTAGISTGADISEVCQLATFAATLSCQKVGTTPISTAEIITFLVTNPSDSQDKIITRRALTEVIQHLPRPIVFTNGCFDVLHPGHIKSLEFASKQGRSLIVACNSDKSVQFLKGFGRPFQDFESRATVLAALSSTSIVCELTEETPLELIKLIKPDVLVKGSDYEEKNVVGREFVESYGGRIELSPILDGFSTTEFEKRVKNLFN